MKKNGFGLIETMIVVAIIGLLAALLITPIVEISGKSAARVKLINGLSQGQNPVLVAKGLYYFRQDGLDGLKAVRSFAEEQTNMTLIASFSVAETHGGSDFGPFWARTESFRSTSRALSVGNGYLAFFRSNLPAEK
jgi:prepilin-type N-terminal cleavage/methylation domain-containing protein